MKTHSLEELTDDQIATAIDHAERDALDAAWNMAETILANDTKPQLRQQATVCKDALIVYAAFMKAATDRAAAKARLQ